MSSQTLTRVAKIIPESISFDPLVISDEPSKAALLEAAQLIKKSVPVAFPAETVYGLGASGLDTPSVKAIYAAKNRPSDNPLILHVSSLDQLRRKLYPDPIPDVYKQLIAKFWPGPLTILLPVPANSNISPACTAGQSTFAVRMPANPVARALIELSDEPLAAPSANASTRPSPTRAEHVLHDLNGRIPLILDGGPSNVGVESTVVDGLSTPPVLLRPGGVSLEQLREFGGPQWQHVVIAKPHAQGSEPVRTPGMKYKHYSPSTPVILVKASSDPNGSPNGSIEKFYQVLKDKNYSKVAVLSTRHFAGDVLDQIKNLVPEVHLTPLGAAGADISRNLFDSLRQVDELSVDAIIVEGIDVDNEGLAVMNRLEKAATITVG